MVTKPVGKIKVSSYLSYYVVSLATLRVSEDTTLSSPPSLHCRSPKCPTEGTLGPCMPVMEVFKVEN
ncbi:hypothetical protein JZ751_023103 [Albula glossodonta]|uniref:Uncharacterized protein n=1 Tax=Albula glossodonta TaxID=121402 RepID=A0A8T2PMN4_9TELE|nr:hypothetical protein JZ751_023103 [Albula glossodonta]